MSRTIKPPHHTEQISWTVFLAGSIEMGVAEKWQDKVVLLLANEDIDIFNPRRDDWDSSWVQSKDNPQFREQVEWELDYAEKADWLFIYFDPKTKSPITLLELGLFATKNEVILICPEGFWRKGNVDIVAERHKNNIKQFATIEQGVNYLKECIVKADNYNDFIEKAKLT